MNDNERRFMDLVEKYQGFELVLGYRDHDTYIGGKDDTYWFLEDTDKKRKAYIGKYRDGEWSDESCLEEKMDLIKSREEAGTTIEKINELAYFYQDRVKEGRKGMKTDNKGISCIRHDFNFGERAVDIAEEYGVTVRYSDINDTKISYSLREINTGKSVKKASI